PAPAAGDDAARVRRRFGALLDRVACHRDPARWHRLYAALWRLTHGEPHLLAVRTDPDVRPLAEMAKAVDREVHKLHAFVRFRVVADDAGPRYVAWFEPAHDVLALAAPLFVRRFASMRWAIVTPFASATWDGASLALGPGAPRPAADGDDAEALWRTYYAHVFNPARVKVQAMRAEMPLRYWRNLPEAELIPSLLREAPHRVREMIERAQAESGRALRAADRGSHEPAARRPQRPAEGSAARAPEPLEIDGCEVRVGTASWTDPTILVPGLFYPHGVDTPEARLRYYAGRFPLAEIDSTYYALPTRKVAALWAERAPAGFVFDVKAHATMTGHPVETARLPRALRDLLPPSLRGATRVPAGELPPAATDAAWTTFLDALEPLGAAGKLGALLLQFPRRSRPTRDAADAPRAPRGRLVLGYAAGRVAAVEFRHRDWYAPRLRARTLALLERLGFAHVVVDAPPGHASSVPMVAEATHPALAIVRLHGRRVETWERPVQVVSERYRYRYSVEELAAFVPPIVDVAKQVQGVHVVFNNCHADYGTSNADEIAALIRRRDALRRTLLDGRAAAG
ncbi:TIGR03915 family putative DNA repair protein, partial [Roseisolibacter sp. H3M3-2]|uniref:TIGR03915 family putative DNA repair protein n=1 Tax=Roseisolibacter sp. H3M3-2 TaxID=3031323 RepID=UPI0023DB4DA3